MSRDRGLTGTDFRGGVQYPLAGFFEYERVAFEARARSLELLCELARIAFHGLHQRPHQRIF